MGPGGERVKHGVRQAGIVIHNMLCRQQNRGNAGGNDDSQNHLLHCIGAALGIYICHGLCTVGEQRIQAHSAHIYTQGMVVHQRFTSGAHLRLKILGVSVTHTGPNVAPWGGCNHRGQNKGMYRRRFVKIRRQKGAVCVVQNRYCRGGRAGGGNGGKGEYRLAAFFPIALPVSSALPPPTAKIISAAATAGFSAKAAMFSRLASPPYHTKSVMVTALPWIAASRRSRTAAMALCPPITTAVAPKGAHTVGICL